MIRATAAAHLLRRKLSSNLGSNKVLEVSVEKTPITSELWLRRDGVRKTNSIDGTTKTSADSQASVRYNFSSNSKLRDLYVDSRGEILIGKLFEDLDSMAGNIALKFCTHKSNQSNLSLVTIAVDSIRLENAALLSCEGDYILSGKVVWKGRSSLDVVVELHKDAPGSTGEACELQPQLLAPRKGEGGEGGGAKSLVLSSLFSYACRDRQTGKASAIMYDLQVESPEEVACFAEREASSQQRRNGASTPPTPGSDTTLTQEGQALYDIGRSMIDMPALAPPQSVLMALTSLENSFITQPQNVNTAGRVFGGLLMHRAYDLAQSTAYIFSGSYPVFSEVEEIAFRKPVDIGDLVRLKSRVVYSGGSTLQVEVLSHIVKPERGVTVVSNTFDFVFRFEDGAKLKTVLPSSTEETLVLLRAARDRQGRAV